jgi:lipopolysaccharide transport system ATP-binding protein
MNIPGDRPEITMHHGPVPHETNGAVAQTGAHCPDPVVLEVAGVSKKFSRSLKASLWYGLVDMALELNPLRRNKTDRHQAGFTDGASRLRQSEFWALHNISFTLRRGECLGLIGHNGAGKTTLLKILNGLIRPDEGTVRVTGNVGALIALGAGFNPILTGRENIYVNAAILGLDKTNVNKIIDQIIDFADIRDFIDAPVQSYSSGMAVRLGFSVAVHCQPDILFLDEVLAVGDVSFQAKCFNKLSEFREKGVSFILVSHNLHQIVRYSDRVLYLSHGQVKFIGEPEIAIEKFLADMNSNQTGQDEERTDWGKVYGSGKLVLTGAEFRDASGARTESIDPGDSFTLAIAYQCPEEPPARVLIDLIIRDNDGLAFQGSSKAYGRVYDSLKSSGELLIEVKDSQFNCSAVNFFFAAMDAETLEVFDWKRFVRLQINPNPLLSGRLALNLVWRSS